MENSFYVNEKKTVSVITTDVVMMNFLPITLKAVALNPGIKIIWGTF